MGEIKKSVKMEGEFPDEVYDPLQSDYELLQLSEEFYNKQWQKRCGNCLSPCCFVEINGLPYKPFGLTKDSDAQYFFTHQFVIIHTKYKSWKEKKDMGFQTILHTEEQELEKLQICPLNTGGKCLIYEDRPLICREWKCVMKCGEIYKGD